MHLILNSDLKIIGSANFAVDEIDCQKRNETVVYIDDSLYKHEMVGTLYIDSEPYYQPAPSQFHVIQKGQYILTDAGISQCWDQVRKTRNQLLALTDWTQLNDVTLSEDDANHYKVMRTELRDITKIQDPFNALSALKQYTFSITGSRPIKTL